MLLLCLMPLLSASLASAEDNAAIEGPRKEEATRLFEAAEQAFQKGDFVRAGEAFEEAYRMAPHPAPLWNAARSFERAGDDTRAANAYARYLREAPEGSRDREAALAAIVSLGKRLGLVEIYAKGALDVRLDNKPLGSDRVYVSPGKHVLEGVVDGKLVQQTESIDAGESRSMALVSPEKAEKPAFLAPAQTLVVPNPVAKNQTKRASWASPLLITSGALTTVSVALLLWSGLDTLEARREFDADPTAEKLQYGKDKQLRTNLLLGASLGFGAVTAGLLSYWLTRQTPRHEPKLAILPMLPGPTGHLSRRGHFGISLAGSF